MWASQDFCILSNPFEINQLRQKLFRHGWDFANPKHKTHKRPYSERIQNNPQKSMGHFCHLSADSAAAQVHEPFAFFAREQNSKNFTSNLLSEGARMAECVAVLFLHLSSQNVYCLPSSQFGSSTHLAPLVQFPKTPKSPPSDEGKEKVTRNRNWKFIVSHVRFQNGKQSALCVCGVCGLCVCKNRWAMEFGERQDRCAREDHNWEFVGGRRKRNCTLGQKQLNCFKLE